MRSKRFLAALLSVALAAPPGVFAQSRAASSTSLALTMQSAEPPLESGPVETFADPIVPPDIAQGVFGVYGGAQSRFSGNSGATTGWRAAIVTQQLPDLGNGGSGSLTPQAERKLGERGMRELRRDPDYLDDWLVRLSSGLRVVHGPRLADQRFLAAGRFYRREHWFDRDDTN
jgi:predicted Zn-dependent protease